MTEKRYWYAIIIIAAALGGVWIVASRVPQNQDDVFDTGLEAVPRKGFSAPDFTLTTLDGATVRLSDLRGKAVLINFWASWCGPCRAEMPHIQAAYEKHTNDGLVVLGVDQAESPATVARFVDEFGLTFPIPLDSDGQVSAAYQARALPTSFFVDAEGVIRDTFTGPMTSGHIESMLEGILPDSTAENGG